MSFLIVVSALWSRMFNIFQITDLAQTHEAWDTRVQVVDAQPAPESPRSLQIGRKFEGKFRDFGKEI
jgi:hypothetical protein